MATYMIIYAAALVLGTQAPAEATSSTWISSFKAHGGSVPLPAPTTGCSVCFFEKPNFEGDSVCIGQRDDDATDVLKISAPTSIGSIQFTNDTCALVANIRVLDPPYKQHVETISVDTADTGYHDVVEELYVEQAGTACFLAAKEVNKLGQCYNQSEPVLDPVYQNAFVEALLFNTAAQPFDVIVYSDHDYNCDQRPGALAKLLAVSTRDLRVSLPHGTTASLANRINSIKFLPIDQSTTIVGSSR
ncbi:TPA: hypothetical protein N0F65_007641 [Lagenidium giganteum]|uniref:Uncharacterized protein n=1 Tax=Lagenidium giganteum TaxID=4803 RepID=A0AAV2Z4E3_9STRA|nr:TPA: hypothetical protein N0F65_007641 [Lagenidium giganteum]